MPNSGTPTSRVTRSNSSSGISIQDIKALIEISENRVIAALKGEIEDLKTTVTSLRLEIYNLQTRQQQLEAKYDEFSEKTAMLRRDQVMTQIELSNELEERLRRSTNFVLSGIPEEDSESSGDSPGSDEEKCTEVLQIIGCDSDSVIEVSRIGRPNQQRPRLLKVKCDSVTAKESVVRNSYKLRNLPKFRGVYINPDRTPMQQRLRRSILDELKSRRQQGEDAIIFRNRVILRKEAKNV